jgi:hypothetical protein
MLDGPDKTVSACHTVEDLFWAVLGSVCARARERKMWISLIAQPGWMYDSAIGALPKWSAAEIKKADRIVWQRTPDG